MCEVTSIMHNNVTNILPPCFSQFFTQNCNVHDFNTRSKHKFHIPQYTKAVSQQSLRYVGSKCWQSVSLAITSTIHTVSKHCFMKNVKKHLISQYQNPHQSRHASSHLCLSSHVCCLHKRPKTQVYNFVILLANHYIFNTPISPTMIKSIHDYKLTFSMVLFCVCVMA